MVEVIYSSYVELFSDEGVYALAEFKVIGED